MTGPTRDGPTGPRWGIVSTIRAPALDITRFVAFHLDLGAAQIDIYLDEPNAKTAAYLAQQPAVRLIQCDAQYWHGKPEKAQRNHRLRQAFNATQSYKTAQVDWLTHIDVDEFILPDQPLAHQLATVPDHLPFTRMRPAEMLAQSDPWQGPSHFKLTRRELGHKTGVLEDIYPDIGAAVHQGFLSHTSGKIFARTGLNGIRLGIHAMKKNGVKSKGHVLADTHIGHAHAPSWDAFRRQFDFRMNAGSYRKLTSDKIELWDVFHAVLDHDGPAGFRQFFAQLCEATPDHLQRLASHDLLLTASLDLDEKVRHWFGEGPNDQ